MHRLAPLRRVAVFLQLRCPRRALLALAAMRFMPFAIEVPTLHLPSGMTVCRAQRCRPSAAGTQASGGQASRFSSPQQPEVREVSKAGSHGGAPLTLLNCSLTMSAQAMYQAMPAGAAQAGSSVGPPFYTAGARPSKPAV